jgi:hypothetical protein
VRDLVEGGCGGVDVEEDSYKEGAGPSWPVRDNGWSRHGGEINTKDVKEVGD